MLRKFPIVFVLLLAQQLVAQDIPDQKFLRVTRDENKTPISFDTAIVRYEKGEDKEKVIMDGVAVVHIADKPYFMNLNRLFKQYDAVCYELVAPKDQKPEPKKQGFHPHTMIGMFLQLESQMVAIDYSANNFVHADLTPEEIGKKMEERGDTAITLILSGLADMMRAQNLKAKETGNKTPQIEISLEDLLNPLKLKRAMVGGFEENIESALGPTAGQYLIKDRNEAALKVLDTQIALGHKKIALFYGAAHFQHFHKEMYKRGFKITTVNWERAWDLSRGSQPDLQQLFKALENLGK